MSRERATRIAGDRLRAAIGWSYVGAVVWAAGNTLTSGMLVNYLAQDLGAAESELAWLQAAPALFGLLRLFTPAIAARQGGVKRTCLSMSVAAYALLALLPLAALGDGNSRAGVSPAWALVVLVCVHQVLEQIATVALWTWLADLIPLRLRGRYFARRNILQLVVIVVALPASGYVTDRLRESHLEHVAAAYASVVAAGAGLLMISLLPLVRMPATAMDTSTTHAHVASWSAIVRRIVAPLRRRDARRLLAYVCWFSFFNGLTAVAQNIYPKGVLRLPLVDVQLMQTVMRLGQMGVSRWAGPFSDRFGNRPVLVACQALVGAGPLFYLLATPSHPYWLYGAFVLWSAYAGLNIGLPNLTMKIAPRGEHASHLAAYYALSSLGLTAGSLAGGYLFKQFEGSSWIVGSVAIDRFQAAFLLAWATRSAGILLVSRVPEAGVRAWRTIVGE